MQLHLAFRDSEYSFKAPMPITPLHFGISTLVALPLYRRVDVLLFLFANVVIDLEPLLVMVLDLNYPLHGYAHTFLGATLLAIISSQILYAGRAWLVPIYRWCEIAFVPSRSRLLVSALLGCWFHVLVDAMIYHEMHPFFPYQGNPMHGHVSVDSMNLLTAFAFIPALILYIFYRKKISSDLSQSHH
jgi:hypothetical protein